MHIKERLKLSKLLKRGKNKNENNVVYLKYRNCIQFKINCNFLFIPRSKYIKY